MTNKYFSKYKVEIFKFIDLNFVTIYWDSHNSLNFLQLLHTKNILNNSKKEKTIFVSFSVNGLLNLHKEI